MSRQSDKIPFLWYFCFMSKDLPRPTKSEHLNLLLERPQTLPGALPSGRIEMVGTRLGRVAAGIFPNGGLKTVCIVVADMDKRELATHMTFVNANGRPLNNASFYSSLAFFDEERLRGSGGLQEFPLPNEERRIEMVNLCDILGRVATAGSAYDPFQNGELTSCLVTAADSVSTLVHPAVLEAVGPLRVSS
jgi:hypothetical protein